MGHHRTKYDKDEEGAPPYRMPDRDRDYMDKLKKAERYKHKEGRRWKQYLKRKHRKKRYHSSDPSSSSSSSNESTTGTSTASDYTAEHNGKQHHKLW